MPLLEDWDKNCFKRNACEGLFVYLPFQLLQLLHNVKLGRFLCFKENFSRVTHTARLVVAVRAIFPYFKYKHLATVLFSFCHVKKSVSKLNANVRNNWFFFRSEARYVIPIYIIMYNPPRYLKYTILLPSKTQLPLSSISTHTLWRSQRRNRKCICSHYYLSILALLKIYLRNTLM